jgi:hypothetical protein
MHGVATSVSTIGLSRRQVPLRLVDPEEDERALKYRAVQFHAYRILLLVEILVVSLIYDVHRSRPLLDGAFVGEKSQGMIEYPDGLDSVMAGVFRVLGEPEGDQGLPSFEHQVPMDPLGRCVLLDYKSVAHIHCSWQTR